MQWWLCRLCGILLPWKYSSAENKAELLVLECIPASEHTSGRIPGLYIEFPPASEVCTGLPPLMVWKRTEVEKKVMTMNQRLQWNLSWSESWLQVSRSHGLRQRPEFKTFSKTICTTSYSTFLTQLCLILQSSHLPFQKEASTIFFNSFPLFLPPILMECPRVPAKLPAATWL